MQNDLTDRVALVTGASRGLGAAIARQLASGGAKVALNCFNSAEKANRLAEEIRTAGRGAAAVFPADVRDESQTEKLVRDVTQSLGPIDILVVNATGPQPALRIEDMSWRNCVDQLEFFVKSPLLLLKAVVGGMKHRRRGRIIMIGSEVFEVGVPGFSSYVAAKGAQLGLTRSWAKELAPWQITVNLVAPGWISTERHAGDSPAAKQAYTAGVPMQRMGVPQDIAATVAFLASDGANFITGQKVSVNGGHTLE
jgi:NAD(P)-dependent dehydrogenase (short-subunit alcohol dehydrogenase family)